MSKQVSLIGVLVCGLVIGIYALTGELGNTKEDAKHIQQPITEPVQNVVARPNENPSYKKDRMYIPTGKEKVFSSEEEIAEAIAELQHKISRGRYALVGYFDRESKSDFFENENYPGGGYYLIDFKINKYLRETENPVSTMSVRVPSEFIKLADQQYLDEIETAMNQLFREFQSVKSKHDNSEITTEEFDIYNIEWKEKFKSMDYVRYFSPKIRRGLNFSIADNTFVLLVNYAFDNGAWDKSTYVFGPIDILPVGYGTFVDVLLPIENDDLDTLHFNNE